MVIGTHARIANRASKQIPASRYLRAFIVLGSVLPDVNPFSHPHRELNLKKHITNNQLKIQSGNSKTIKCIRLGNMLHYLCDYFCYAHNEDLEISHGAKHTAYEMELGREFKEGFEARLKEMPVSGGVTVINNLEKVKENYERKPGNCHRDLKYALSAVDYCVSFMSQSMWLWWLIFNLINAKAAFNGSLLFCFKGKKHGIFH